MIEDKRAKSPEDLASEKEMKDIIKKALQSVLKYLNERDRRVISMRFGLGYYKREHTLQEIANTLELSRERIRQIESSALKILKEYIDKLENLL